MATLATVIGGATIALSGKKTQTTPPIQAESSDEEKFIKYTHSVSPKPTTLCQRFLDGWMVLMCSTLDREFIAKAEAESAKEKR